jgi:hypothetical protein
MPELMATANCVSTLSRFRGAEQACLSRQRYGIETTVEASVGSSRAVPGSVVAMPKIALLLRLSGFQIQRKENGPRGGIQLAPARQLVIAESVSE